MLLHGVVDIVEEGVLSWTSMLASVLVNGGADKFSFAVQHWAANFVPSEQLSLSSWNEVRMGLFVVAMAAATAFQKVLLIAPMIVGKVEMRQKWEVMRMKPFRLSLRSEF